MGAVASLNHWPRAWRGTVSSPAAAPLGGWCKFVVWANRGVACWLWHNLKVSLHRNFVVAHSCA